MVRGRGEMICMDDDPPSEKRAVVSWVEGSMKPPVITHRVDPQFPIQAKRGIKNGSIRVVLEMIVTKHGCIRNLRLLSQSPWPELNSAAVLAISKWRFRPSTRDGEPVDCIYNLTVNFRL